MKKILVVTAVIGMLGVSAMGVYAATAQTPAEITAGLTGKTVEELYIQHQEGSTYGEIASEAGFLDAFKEQSLIAKKAILDERVAAGTLTQEEADAYYAALVENQLTCDGSGDNALKMENGLGFGAGNGLHNGTGQGLKNGSGQGLKNGTGTNQGTGRGMGRNR